MRWEVPAGGVNIGEERPETRPPGAPGAVLPRPPCANPDSSCDAGEHGDLDFGFTAALRGAQE